MAINVEEIVKKIIDGDVHAADDLKGDDLKELMKHPFFADDDYNPHPMSNEEAAALEESLSHEAASDEEIEKYGSDWGPMCSFCKHIKQNGPWKVTCAAFPDGVPTEILMGKDHRKPVEGDKNIQFEAKPGLEKAFADWMAFFENPAVESPKEAPKKEEEAPKEVPAEEKPVEEKPAEEEKKPVKSVRAKVKAPAPTTEVKEELPKKVAGKSK